MRMEIVLSEEKDEIDLDIDITDDFFDIDK